MSEIRRRIPTNVPFVLRWSLFRLGLLFLFAGATIELGIGLQSDPADLADLYSTWWVHVLVAAPLLTAWLILARQGAILALSRDGLWVSTGAWPRPMGVYLSWSEVVAIRDGRVQWHHGVTVQLTASARSELIARGHARIEAAFAVARKAYGNGADLTASLTLANASSRQLADALSTIAPPTLPWAVTVPPRQGAVGLWSGRIALTVSWIALVVFALPTWLTRAFDLTDVAVSVVGYWCGAAGAAGVPWVISTYEAVVARVFLGGARVEGTLNDRPT